MDDEDVCNLSRSCLGYSWVLEIVEGKVVDIVKDIVVVDEECFV